MQQLDKLDISMCSDSPDIDNAADGIRIHCPFILGYLYLQLTVPIKAQHSSKSKKSTLKRTLREMREQAGRDKLVTRGQALHLGGNEPPTLALMCPNRSLEDREGSAGQLGVQGHTEKWGVRFPITSGKWEIKSLHMNRHLGTGTEEQWSVFLRRPAGFPLLGYRHRQVFFLIPLPSVPSFPTALAILSLF